MNKTLTQRNNLEARLIENDTSYFKHTISPKPTTLSSGGKIVYLYDDITEESINRVISEIMPLLGTGDSLQLRIKTQGGTLYDCFALIDIIRKYDIPVHVDGYAMSGGFLIFAAAPTRTMSPYSHLMYHDMTYGVYGQRSRHKNELVHTEKLSKLYHKLICEYTDITPKMLKKYDEPQLEWYIDYEEAKDLYIVNQELLEVKTTIPAAEQTEVTQLEYVKLDRKTEEKKKSQKSRGQINTETYWEVFNRDLGKCVVCGSRSGIEEHHVIPRSRGGTGTPDNLCLLCKKCHYVKLHGMGDFVTIMRVFQYMITLGYTKYRSNLNRLQAKEEALNGQGVT